MATTLTAISLSTYNSGTTGSALTNLTTGASQEFLVNIQDTSKFMIMLQDFSTVSYLDIGSTSTGSDGDFSDSELGSVRIWNELYHGGALGTGVQSTAGSTETSYLCMYGPFESARFCGSTGDFTVNYVTTSATTLIGGKIGVVSIDV